MNWWQQLLVSAYATYALVIVVDLYCDRETRPVNARSHLIVWCIALGWPPALVYFLTDRLVRKLRYRRLIKRSSFAQVFEQATRVRRADVRRVTDRAQVIADGRLAVNPLPYVDELPHAPFSLHPDAAYGGRERMRICLDPECHCRDHRDVDPDHYPIRNPEDHWR